MTNAMPSLQMTIKLSYGWRPLCPPGGAKLYTREMFGEFAQSAKMPNIFLRRSSSFQEGRAPPLRVMRVFCNRSFLHV